MKRYIKSARNAKKVEVYVSQEYVPGYGWEDITVYDNTSSESLKLAKQDVRDYIDNGYNAKVIKRRIDNPDYAAPTNELTYDVAVDWVESSPYDVEEVWTMDGKNYLLRSDPKKWTSAQVFIREDGTVTVRNVTGNRSKQVYSIDELEKEVNRILSK